MNILFANYGNFTTNSLNHIGGFANWLGTQGHACIVAVPDGKETVASVDHPHFLAATFAEVLAHPALFPDQRPADVIHAWTPRESVRKFILAHQRLHPARVIIHLEDHEEHLAATFARRPFAELRTLADDELRAVLDDALPHPHRYKNLLRLVDGITVINDRLRELIPTEMPVHTLLPGVDFALYHPAAAAPALRTELGLRPEEKIIAFTGSTTFANADEMRELVRAVHMLNARGLPVRLVRTGFHPTEFTDQYGFDWQRFTLDLGFVEKRRLPALLAMADVLVQPGRPGVFNDYRLPSKLPEFLSVGKAVILPASNVGGQLRDGIDALLLKQGDAEEIAAHCQRVFADPALAAALGVNAAAFARRQFDSSRIIPGLLTFYRNILTRPPRTDWSTLVADSLTETSLLPAELRQEIVRLVPAGSPALAQLLAGLDDLGQAIALAETSLGRGLAKELEEKLRAEITRLQSRADLTEKHTANLTIELQETRLGLTTLEAELARAQQRIADLEAAFASARQLAYNYQAELVQSVERAEADALAELHRWQGVVADREDKIRRLQSSFSWRITTPLRALRRVFLDPLRSPLTPKTAPLAPQPTPESEPVAPGPTFQIDEPAFWHVPAGALPIRGWCLHADGSAATRVRAQLGGRTFFGAVGQPRQDVAAIHGAGPASHCGFELYLTVEPGRHPLDIEAEDNAGAWQLLVKAELRVFAPARPPAAETYSQWLRLYEPSGPQALAALASRVMAQPAQPLISILLPVYNTPERWLRRAIGSVKAQIYPHWELCVADDASQAPHIHPLLEEAARSDPRIKVTFRAENGHISAASNTALGMATGEFIALLDHDDELAPQALAEIVLALAANPEADLLYSDEDKIDEAGRRFAPYFKPDFLPDLFLSQNYLTHLAVYRASVIRAVNGFRPGFEGSQDWDLALRVYEKTTPAAIVHIPRILYHWRAIPGSTALTLDQKTYHVPAAQRALQEHLTRTGQAANLIPVAGDHWRIRYDLPTPPPLVSILIPTRNGVRHLRRCLDSISSKTTYPRYEILVIDNGSDDEATVSYLKLISAKGVHVLPYPGPFNYSALNNHAARAAAGDVLALLNDDLEVISPDWLEEMVSQAMRPGIGCVGAMLYYPSERIQHAGVVLGIGGGGGLDGVAGHAFKNSPRGAEGAFNRARLVQNYSAVTAACLVVRKALYEQVGGLDEKELRVAFNDVDFCLKVRAAGYRNLWTPFAELYHHESASRGPEDSPAKLARFRGEIETMRKRWAPLLDNDPAYNPNLTCNAEDFSLAHPPRQPG